MLTSLLWFSSLLLAFVSVRNSTAQSPTDKRQLQRDPAQQTSQIYQQRIALVIGNGAYTNAPPLKNPPNDARDIAATLKALGFEVASGVNVNQRDMKRLIREFGQKLKGGGSGLFYYAGHGVQSKGKNYLIPVEADIQSEVEVEDAGVDVNLVLGFMDDAQNGLNIVILDACRDNPFARSFRSASNGLAQVDAPTGTLIAYATAPGRVASDGIGQNGLYTSELLKQMRVPAVSVTEMFMRVRAEVMKQTNNKQVPWEASSLVGTFYFSPPAKNGASTTTSEAVNETRIDPAAVEREYWESIRNSTNPQDYRDYLTNYPNGTYAAIAKTKLRQLDETASQPRKPVQTVVRAKTFSFELKECRFVGATVSCSLSITNNGSSDQPLAYYRLAPERVSKVIDNEGNQGNPVEGQIGNIRADYTHMVPNVPTRATINFEGVSSEAVTLKLLSLWFATLKDGFIVDSFKVEFRDQPLK